MQAELFFFVLIFGFQGGFFFVTFGFAGGTFFLKLLVLQGDARTGTGLGRTEVEGSEETERSSGEDTCKKRWE